MHKSHPKPDEAVRLDLAALLGQRQAFGSIAGRCSAAQAAALHYIRHAARFQRVTSRWREFCSLHLGIDGRNADKIIQLWDEFGAPYFELAQLTRVRPDTYRALAPFVHDGALHLDGDAIELRPENSRRLAAAIAGFPRAASPSKPARSLPTSASPLSTNALPPSSPNCNSFPPTNAAARTGSNSSPSSPASPPPCTASLWKTACTKSPFPYLRDRLPHKARTGDQLRCFSEPRNPPPRPISQPLQR